MILLPESRRIFPDTLHPRSGEPARRIICRIIYIIAEKIFSKIFRTLYILS